MKDHPPLTPEQWEMIWECVQYTIGSYQYLQQHDRIGKLAPPEMKESANHFLKRRTELQRLARIIEDRLIEMEKNG
jgi:hypothetical protein